MASAGVFCCCYCCCCYCCCCFVVVVFSLASLQKTYIRICIACELAGISKIKTSKKNNLLHICGMTQCYTCNYTTENFVWQAFQGFHKTSYPWQYIFLADRLHWWWHTRRSSCYFHDCYASWTLYTCTCTWSQETFHVKLLNYMYHMWSHYC